MEEMETFSILNSLGVCQRNEEDILSRGKKQTCVQRYENAQGVQLIVISWNK